MRKFFSVLMAIGLSAPALAESMDVDVTGARCTVVQAGNGDDARTSSACATGVELPSVKFNFDDYSLLADFSSKDIGAEYTLCPGAAIGFTGAASTSKEGGDEDHASKATVYARTSSSHGDGKIEVKASASRTQAVGSLSNDAAGLSVKYYLSRESVTPFVAADYSYAWQTTDDTSQQAGSLLLGVRASIQK